MADATFTFQVEEELKTAFSEAAKAHDQTGADVLRDFMRDYVSQQQEASDYDHWLREKVRRAQASADDGDIIPGDEVEAEFVQLRDQARKSAAQ